MTATLAQQILNASRPKVEPVDFAGNPVFVHELSVSEAADFYGAYQQAQKDGTHSPGECLNGLLLARAVRDESGARVFSDEQVPELLALSGPAVNPVIRAAQRLNKIGQAEDAAEKK